VRSARPRSADEATSRATGRERPHDTSEVTDCSSCDVEHVPEASYPDRGDRGSVGIGTAHAVRDRRSPTPRVWRSDGSRSCRVHSSNKGLALRDDEVPQGRDRSDPVAANTWRWRVGAWLLRGERATYPPRSSAPIRSAAARAPQRSFDDRRVGRPVTPSVFSAAARIHASSAERGRAERTFPRESPSEACGGFHTRRCANRFSIGLSALRSVPWKTMRQSLLHWARRSALRALEADAPAAPPLRSPRAVYPAASARTTTCEPVIGLGAIRSPVGRSVRASKNESAIASPAR
jgi:hypothetical protein